MIKSPGQIAYEADVAANPRYDDGTPRRPWHLIGEEARWTWERNPTPRTVTTPPTEGGE